MNKLSIGLRLTLAYFVVFAAAQFLFGFGMRSVEGGWRGHPLPCLFASLVRT